MKTKRLQPIGQVEVKDGSKFLASLIDLEKGNCSALSLSAEDFEIKHFQTEPFDETTLPTNFPFCCQSHEALYNAALEGFNAFPNCCNQHKRLIDATWFNKTDYLYMPMKLVRAIAYTLDCIDKCISNSNWFKEISDYIDYTVRSFGQFPGGYGPPLGLSQYLSGLRNNINAKTYISIDRRDKLLNYLASLSDPPSKKSADLNLLMDIYKEWLDLFPFQLFDQTELKSKFSLAMPILQGEGETNIYTGLTSSKLITKKKLLQFLTNTTLKILIEISTVKVLEKNKNIKYATDLELLLAKRKIELSELSALNKNDRALYKKILKKWLEGERKFIRQLKPLLSN